MALTIPVDNTAAYTQELTIEENVYRFSFHWNSRGSFWSMDLLDLELSPLVMGVKLVVAFDLLAPYRYLDIPQGAFVVTDPADTYAELGRDDLGARSQLIYLTEDEIAAV